MQHLRAPFAISATAFALAWFALRPPPMPLPPASFAGKRALVFGGTSGIGRGIALKLGSLGASVTVVGRDAARGEEVVAALRASNPGGAHAFSPCNAFLLKEVAATAAAAQPAAAPPLDLLVLSQGMATLQGFTPTAEGLDEKLSLHYWGRVAATRELLPALRRAPAPVVLSVLSGGVHSPFAGWREDFELSKGAYSLPNAANAAGFYNDIAVEAQAGETSNNGVLFLHAAPGFVNTRWGVEMPWYVRYLVRAIQPLGKSPEACAEAMLKPVAARAKGAAGGGWAIIDQHGGLAAPTAAQGEARDGVWDQTRKVLVRVLGKDFWERSL